MGIQKEFFECQNYTESNESINLVDCNAIIGYSENPSVPVVFLIFSVVGLILNVIFYKAKKQ